MRATPEPIHSGPAALAVELRPSPLLALFVISCHLLACLGLALAALPWPVQILGLALLIWHLRHCALRHWRQLPQRICYANGEWLLVRGRHSNRLQLEGEQLVWPALLVLRGRLDSGRLGVLVLPADALDAEDLRRLRVVLRWPPRAAAGLNPPRR